MVAAKNAVAAPIQAMSDKVDGARTNRKCSRAVIYTPAVTMVAAWINALTGVGPAMASGSQTKSGICADLPVAPTKRNSVANVITGTPQIMESLMVGAHFTISRKVSEP